MNQDQDTLGGYLRLKREALLVTIQEIAVHTGVKRDLIEALEADSYQAFSHRAQAQLLVKQVAAYLKMNESDILRRFDLQWRLYESKKSFQRLSSFTDPEPSDSKPPILKGIKSSVPWQFPKIPPIPALQDFPKIKIRLPIMLAVFLIGLFLLIDLPFSKQKSLPPADPRFSDTAKKQPPANVEVLPPPAEKVKTERFPPDIPPPQKGAARPAVSAERSPSASKNVKVVGNSDTKRYHLPGMKFYDKIKAFHRVVFQSEKEAINAGYHKAKE